MSSLNTIIVSFLLFVGLSLLVSCLSGFLLSFFSGAWLLTVVFALFGGFLTGAVMRLAVALEGGIKNE